VVVGCIFFSVLGLIVFFSMSSGSSRSLSSGNSGVLAATAQKRDYDWLARRGVVGQGILLQVSPNRAKASTSSGINLETREVVIDIEVPGAPPYQVRTSPFIPVHLSGDVLPGATVELRVDPGDPTQFVIFGPGVGLPLAPFAGAPAVGAKAIAQLTAPQPALVTSGTGDLGMDKCSSCGAQVNVAEMLRRNRHCPVCGAKWD
jgi:hypothetical protein